MIQVRRVSVRPGDSVRFCPHSKYFRSFKPSHTIPQVSARSLEKVKRYMRYLVPVVTCHSVGHGPTYSNVLRDLCDSCGLVCFLLRLDCSSPFSCVCRQLVPPVLRCHGGVRFCVCGEILAEITQAIPTEQPWASCQSSHSSSKRSERLW